MLKTILTSETCGKCRNCCVFFSKSRWEMPSVPKENVMEICGFLGDDNAVEIRDGIYKLKSKLRDISCEDNTEEYRCPALDENKGCMLPENLKPLECSMWPIRVMRDNGNVYITLAKGCHAVDEKFITMAKKLIDDGLYGRITDVIRKDKTIIRDYDSTYEKLLEIKEEM